MTGARSRSITYGIMGRLNISFPSSSRREAAALRPAFFISMSAFEAALRPRLPPLGCVTEAPLPQ